MKQILFVGVVIFIVCISTNLKCRADKPRDSIFKIDKLTQKDISSLKESRVWKPGCPVAVERLRIVKVSYWDFKEQMHTDGEIMVLDVVAEPVLRIFKSLYEIKFPLSHVRLMDHNDGNDAKSMQDNNTSGFNCRPISGGSTLSLHAYGLAIDINPIQNPFIQTGKHHLYRNSRKPLRPGMAEPIVAIFKKNGFTIWGGDWKKPVDYQHFQVPRKIAEQLVKLEYEEATAIFKTFIHD